MIYVYRAGLASKIIYRARLIVKASREAPQKIYITRGLQYRFDIYRAGLIVQASREAPQKYISRVVLEEHIIRMAR